MIFFFIFLAYLFIETMWSVGTVNWGTASRHHVVTYGLLAILAFSTWSAFARQVRAETLVLKQLDYVSLAKVAGCSHFRILAKHILPGVVNTIVVIATLRVGAVIMFEAILSYLGAGIPPPTPSWGSMVSDGRDYLPTAWWIAFFPGVAIFLTVTALNFMGDWLRDKLDPRLRQSV